ASTRPTFRVGPRRDGNFISDSAISSEPARASLARGPAAMMRIQRLAAAAALITFGSTALAAQSTAPGRVAYVALQAILQQTPGYTEAEQIWTTEVEGFRSEMTRLQNQLDSATAAFEQASVMLSASARQAE